MLLLLMRKTTTKKKHLLFLKSSYCYYCCLVVSGSGGVVAEAQQRRRGVAFLATTGTYCSRAYCDVRSSTIRYSSSSSSTTTTTSRGRISTSTRMSSTSSTYPSPRKAVPYNPPSWCKDRLLNVPEHGRLQIANLPTPLYQVQVETSATTSADNKSNNNNPFLRAVRDNKMTFLIKRDDCTSGVEMGGNKIRKLEFLIADALARDYDSVVTIGGQQSNHCRATAAISSMVGLQPHLILRTSTSPTPTRDKESDTNDQDEQNDLGLIGNLLVDRMVGSQIYTCTPGEYGRIGSNELISRLCTWLQDNNGPRKKPYPIPVGGSNALGTWGYIDAVQELLSQLQQSYQNDPDDDDNLHLPKLDHIVFACGSGGTAAGIALGIALAYNKSTVNPPKVHAVGVCDDPNYFYKHVATIAHGMGLVVNDDPSTSLSASSLEEIETYIRKHMIVHQGKGLGYAKSTPEELEFVSSFARETGIVLDPVYSGKALYKFYKDVLLLEEDTGGGEYHGQSVLFWHTGGALGLYEKCDDLIGSLKDVSPCQRLDVYGKGNGIDLSVPSTSTTS